MEESEYNKLVAERERLKGLRPQTPNHKQEVARQLSTVRERLKNAHRERYATELSARTGSNRA